MFYSNYGSISCRFWDIQCRIISRPWNPSQKSIKVIESGTIQKTGYSSLLVFRSKFVPKTHRFWDIRLQKCCDHENRIGPVGSVKVIEMSSFDRAHTTFYCYRNMAISLLISEIFNVDRNYDLEITVRGQSRSLKVVPCDTLDMVSY